MNGSATREVQTHVTVRRARGEDAEAAGAICYAGFKSIAERHGFPPDFPDEVTARSLMGQLFLRGDVYGVVAELEGNVVGSNFLWENGEVAGVGPITVAPAMQDRSVGRALMQAVLERAQAQGATSVRLVQAAYHGRSLSLYIKLGFEAQEPLSVLQGKPLNLRLDGFDVGSASEADIPAAEHLYQRTHGHTRTGELRAAISRGTASTVKRGGRLTGYTTGIGFFGHAVGETVEDLQALIGAASSFAGPGFLVPTRSTILMRWCLERGLRIIQPMMLMAKGRYDEPKGAFLPSVLY
jgi:ribosomal protein S18 acetylase RimI-like enzyme